MLKGRVYILNEIKFIREHELAFSKQLLRYHSVNVI